MKMELQFMANKIKPFRCSHLCLRVECEECPHHVVVRPAVVDEQLPQLVHRPQLGDDVRALRRDEDEPARGLRVLHRGQRRLLRREAVPVELHHPRWLRHLVHGPDAAVERESGLALHEDGLEGECVGGQEPHEVGVVVLGGGQHESAWEENKAVKIELFDWVGYEIYE